MRQVMGGVGRSVKDEGAAGRANVTSHHLCARCVSLWLMAAYIHCLTHEETDNVLH
jgi:hypothetical protein